MKPKELLGRTVMSLMKDQRLNLSNGTLLRRTLLAGSLPSEMPPFRSIMARLKPRVDVFSGEETVPEFDD
jgi:hypothetical protein